MPSMLAAAATIMTALAAPCAAAESHTYRSEFTVSALGDRFGNQTSYQSCEANSDFGTPRGGRRTVPMRRPSFFALGVPSLMTCTAIVRSLCSKLLQDFGIKLCNLDQGLGGAGGLSATLLPVLERADGDAQQRGESRLRQAGNQARVRNFRDGGAVGAGTRPRLHLADGRQKLGADIGPFEVWNKEFSIVEKKFDVPGLGYCTPTCSNGRQGEGEPETDLDCGGECTRGCGESKQCKVNSDCASGICNVFTCVACNANSQCPASQHCDTLVGGDFRCESDYGNDVGGCDGDAWCTSGHCVSGTCRQCVTNGNCSSSQWCKDLHCVTKSPNGTVCGSAVECASGCCNFPFTCGPCP